MKQEKQIFDLIHNQKLKKNSKIKIKLMINTYLSDTDQIDYLLIIKYNIKYIGWFSATITKADNMYFFQDDFYNGKNLNKIVKLIKKETIQEDRINKINQII